MPESPLDSVLASAAAGEPWALRRLYDELAPAVVGYLRVRGAHEPEDLTSEVFLAVFTRLATVTGGASGLRTLLFSVAHARLVDDLRRRSRREESVPFDERADRRTSASAEDEALEAHSVEAVRDIIGQLPDDQRDVLLMRLVGDLTLDQVAEAMGKTSGAVKQLQRRGLLTLKARLSSSGVPL
jgi:RNA polymerase sigma-70 factor (ECF subfamily)